MDKTNKTFLIVSSLIVLILIHLIFLTQNESKVLSCEIEKPQIDFKKQVLDLALSNGFKPSERIVNSILVASQTYNVDALELTAIGIVETGLGKYIKTRKNTNGTHDKGLFQINTVNHSKCVEYNLDSPEGSSLCAAKLLSTIKTKRSDYLGVYHSKTPTKKMIYLKKISKVFKNQTDK